MPVRRMHSARVAQRHSKRIETLDKPVLAETGPCPWTLARITVEDYKYTD